MYLINRSISILIPLLIFIGLEIILARPNWLWWIIPFLLFLPFLALWQLMNQKITKEFWQFSLAPFLFLLSGLLFFILLTPKNDWLKHLLILIITGFLAIILESVFNFLHRQEKYPLFAIENIYSYLDLITFFFFLASFYYLIVFSNFPLWLLLLFTIIIVGFLSYQVFWANKILTPELKSRGYPNGTAYLFILVISLILGELFWIINFWPTGFYFNALLLSLFYYIIIGISRYHLLGQLNKKVVRKYLVIGGICLVVILVTVRWG
jgi:hypothetical protein